MIDNCIEIFGEECVKIFGDPPVNGKQRGDSSTDSDSINSILGPSSYQQPGKYSNEKRIKSDFKMVFDNLISYKNSCVFPMIHSISNNLQKKVVPNVIHIFESLF